jgi:hypothetical protein
MPAAPSIPAAPPAPGVPAPVGPAWPFDTIPAADDGPHLQKLRADVAQRQYSIATTGSPDGGGKPGSGFRAWWITVPIGLLFLLPIGVSSGSGTHTVPLWERLIPAILVALIGSRRLRWTALGTLIVVLVLWFRLGGPT